MVIPTANISWNMNHVDQIITNKLKERAEAGNLRKLSTIKNRVDFYSNDYLGLVTTGYLAELAHASDSRHATGSTGSRLLSGNSEQIEALEQTIAIFHGAEAALIFNSGYDANIGLLSCIADRHTTYLYDELCHASIIDGIRLSQCHNRYKFHHNDLHDLEEKLEKYSGGPVIVVVESVYSMDGDLSPLSDIANICERHGAQLVVDEAHATGVFGRRGEGRVCELGLQRRVFARVHTFGKALGCHGAAVVGSDALKQYLVNFARSFIYTTALSPAAIHTIHCAYQYLSGHRFDNKPLHDLIAYFRSCLKEFESAPWKDSISPIQAVIVPGNDQCRRLASKLQEAGLQVNPILHPTVAQGEERLRICLHSFNTKEQVDMLLSYAR